MLALVLAGALSPHAAIAQQADQASAVTQAYNISGQQLFAGFSRKPGNVVFSPVSIGSAMAMVLSGARGETRDEMAKILRHTQPLEAIDGENKRILTLLNGYDRSGQKPSCPADMRLNGERCEMPAPADGGCPPGVNREGDLCATRPAAAASAKLRVANALMLVKDTVPLAADYEQAIKQQYDAEFFRNVGLAEINGWVSQKTEGKIEKILEELGKDASYVLLNAVYFNALWATPFSKSATRDEDFSLTSTKKVRVPMMRQESAYAIVARDGYQAIALPYSVASLAMIVVRPDNIEGVDKVRARLDGAETARLFTALRAQRPSTVALSMPRFKASYEVDLIAPFKQLGMSKVFGASTSDLSGITGVPPAQIQAWIQQIQHRAVIEVAEEGTEAAAATAVVIGTRTISTVPPPVVPPFRIDRPFLFYVVDEATGAILFQGRMVDPQS
jgi:serpin B